MTTTTFYPTSINGKWGVMNLETNRVSPAFRFDDWNTAAIICANMMGMTLNEAKLIWDHIYMNSTPKNFGVEEKSSDTKNETNRKENCKMEKINYYPTFIDGSWRVRDVENNRLLISKYENWITAAMISAAYSGKLLSEVEEFYKQNTEFAA